MKALHDLYTGPINVWVEDEVTRNTLTSLWRDTQVRVHLGGSQRGVQFAVDEAREVSTTLVVGVVDRDFQDDDSARWRDTPVLRLRAHECENLLLDFEIIAGLSEGQTADGLRGVAHQHATALLWWTACCAVMHELHESFGPSLPRRPRQGDVRTSQEATEHIRGSTELDAHVRAVTNCTNSATIRDLVQSKGTELEVHLTGDTWLSVFPGKEILRHLRSTVPGLDAAKSGITPTERDLDLAKRITRAMAQEDRIPAELTELLQILRQRGRL